MKKPYKDQVLGALMVALALFFSWQTVLLPESTLEGDPGPKIFPAVACFLIGFCGLLLIINPSKKPGRQFLSKTEWKRLLTLYSLYVAYWALLWLVGYKIAIPVILFAISTLFSRSKKVGWVKILIYTAGVTAFMFLLYTVILKTRLPEGILFNL